MNLVEKLDKDMIAAMKSGQKQKLMIIREIKAGMKQAMIDFKREQNEELLIEIVSKGIKSRKESIIEFTKGARADLISKTEEEIKILEEYLPIQLTEEEVEAILDEVFNKVAPTSAKDMGLIMKEITPLIKGKYDMKEVSNLIKNRLNNI